MRGKLIYFGICAIALLGCRFFSPANPPATPARQVEKAALPSEMPTGSPSATVAPAETPAVLDASNTATSHAEVGPSIAIQAAVMSVTEMPEFVIKTHPENGLYVGDRVSFEVLAPTGTALEEETLQIYNAADGTPLAEAGFYPFGIGGRDQATIYWGWDTAGYEPGAYPLDFAIQPLGYTWTQTVTLGAAADVPPPEPLAAWQIEESDCCIFYYLSETAADRDISTTLRLADARAAHAIDVMGGEFSEPLEVTLMPRVLGQGGFAGGEIYISYLDRNYAGSNLSMVLHHEMIHILDRRAGGVIRPRILVEGLAVYLTGGHFKPEQLLPRAAALLAPAERASGLGLDWYLPLIPLSDDFYNSQHEIGYLQAGALVEYMVNRWGWARFDAFYRDIHPTEDGRESSAINEALNRHFGIEYSTLEADFLKSLQETEITIAEIEDVRLTVTFFDTMRRYQQMFDPSAYFLTAWLPNGPYMRENGITADLLRHPEALENLTLETMLVAASDAAASGDYEAAAETVASVNLVLDGFAAEMEAPFSAHPLGQIHLSIASQILAEGYQVQWVSLNGERATAAGNQGWPELTFFVFTRDGDDWVRADWRGGRE